MWIILPLIAAAGGLAAAVAVRTVRRQRSAVIERVDATLREGRYADARERAFMALAARPNPSVSVELSCRLARALVGQEEYVAAEKTCRDAAEAAVNPVDRAKALVELGRSLAAAGELDAARGALEQTRATTLPPLVRAERELTIADIELTRLRFDEAERALAEVYNPSNLVAFAGEAAILHARLQYLRGNFNQAIAEINRVLERVEGDDLQALALFTLARALIDQERPAAVEADQAISSAQLLVRFPGHAAIVTACAALVQAHFDNVDEALEAARRAPRLTVSKRFLAEAHCLVGDAMRRLGRTGEARMHYQTALGIDAGWLEALWGLGKCAQTSGLDDVADSYFHLCIEAAPEHFIGQRSEHAIE